MTSTNPAAGSDINYQPSTMTVTFDNSDPPDLGQPVRLHDRRQHRHRRHRRRAITLSASRSRRLTDGVHNVSHQRLVDIHGVTAHARQLHASQTDTVPPVRRLELDPRWRGLLPGAQNITEVVTFSEPMNTSLSPVSRSLSARSAASTTRRHRHAGIRPDTILTIQYNNLPTDAYQFTLYAYGLPGPGRQYPGRAASRSTSPIVGGTSTFPSLTPVLPLGSLVYQGTVDNVLVSPTDADTYNLAIDPTQTLAVVVTPGHVQP